MSPPWPSTWPAMTPPISRASKCRLMVGSWRSKRDTNSPRRDRAFAFEVGLGHADCIDRMERRYSPRASHVFPPHFTYQAICLSRLRRMEFYRIRSKNTPAKRLAINTVIFGTVMRCRPSPGEAHTGPSLIFMVTHELRTQYPFDQARSNSRSLDGCRQWRQP